MLKAGFDPNSVGEKGDPALVLAAKYEAPKVLELLLSQPGIKVDAINSAGETALMLAAIRGTLASCERLIAKGAAVNRTGWAPLHYAASGPSADVVKLLLTKGAQVDAPTANGTTALMMAARYGSEDSVNTLLANKADPRVRNQVDKNAADFARSAGRDSLAERLAKLAG